MTEVLDSVRPTLPDDGTQQLVAQTVERAAEAASAWRRTPPGDRARALRRAADAVRAEAASLGDTLCAETGRLLREARASAEVAADALEEAAVAGVLGSRSLAGGPGAVDWTRREPYGVVAVVTPWNDPLPIAAGLLAAALVTGNVVVHKPSERCPRTGAALTRAVADHLPAGVLELLEGDGAAGRALVADERVDLVAHVGSTATGREIARTCAGRGAAYLLENGGKDALVVDEGVDPSWAAQQIATGAFTNAGQLCTSVERVYLHRAVAEPVLEALVAQAERLVVGDPREDSTTMGGLVDERQLTVVADHVSDAVRRGARLLAGGTRLSDTQPWYAATVLTDCADEMLLMREETFGPVAPCRVVDSWAEALAAAGSGRYGLAATVLTPDPRHALEAVDRLDVGTVKVNAVFGGAPAGSAEPRGESGRGCGYGPALLEELTRLKAVHYEPTPAASAAAETTG